jgi:hypothetical protein
MRKHKIAVGLFLSGSHFSILILILVFWSINGFLFDEMVTAIGLIGPLFAGYTSAIFAYIIDEAEAISTPDAPVSLPFRIASFAAPIIFVLTVGGAVVLWSFKIGFTDFEQFKILVGILEGAFGIYVGQFIYSMFKKPKRRGAGGR